VLELQRPEGGSKVRNRLIQAPVFWFTVNSSTQVIIRKSFAKVQIEFYAKAASDRSSKVVEVSKPLTPVRKSSIGVLPPPL
jgi:hypothetical protein